jgi:cysteine desulfurase
LAEPGNASSVHAFGRAARRALAAARKTVAAAVGADLAGVIFTSGGTEANNLALLGLDGPRLVSAVEHPSVLEADPEAPRIPARGDGVIDLGALTDLLAAHRPRLVSLMLANNETGVIQPVAEAAALVHAVGALLHVDAAQALGRIPVDMKTLGADLLTLSAHKMGGPPGVGALVLRGGLEIAPRQRGGGQEAFRRAGTESLPAILGWAAAISAIERGEAERIAWLRTTLEQHVKRHCPEAIIIGYHAPRLPNTCCLLLPGVDGAAQLMALDLEGVAVSTGAACSSGKVGPSHVLLAMGLAEADARCAIRVSLGWSSTEQDVARFVAAWRGLRERVRARCRAMT